LLSNNLCRYREAAIAMETARHAREIAEQATAAAQDLPENEVVGVAPLFTTLSCSQDINR
jgi:hypothetical protein